MVISFPSDTEDTIDAIRNVIGRAVIFNVVASNNPCTVCDLDPVTNESTDPFCTTCSGLYWIPVISGASVQAHVTWAGADQLDWFPAGQVFDGDCRVQIKKTDANIYIIDNTKDITVDGKTMEIQKKIFRGVPELNRILIDLKEKEN